MSLYNEETAVLESSRIHDYKRSLYAHDPDHQTEEELFPYGEINNVFEFKSTDIKMQQLNGNNGNKLKVTLPKVKGEGGVCYKKYAPYLMIQRISVSIVNSDDGKEIEVNSMTNRNLLETAMCKGNNIYFQNCFGDREKYLQKRIGKHNDEVIFPQRDLTVLINGLIPDKFIIAPDTSIIFRIEFLPHKEILSYDELFKRKSLEYLEKSKYKNVSLLVSNTNILKKESTLPTTPNFFIKKNTVIGDIDTEILPTATFKNSYIVSFATESDVFTQNNKFIIIPESDTREKTLIKRWTLTILKDLIRVTDLDLSQNENKEKLGFSKEAKFEEVINNTVYFDIDKRCYCKIFIENIPEDFKIYYHRNILSFSRNFDRNNVLNISNLFKVIKGVCFTEDECKVEYLYESIVHNIDLSHISIPVNIWTHESNTETGDLRNIESKKEDMYYSNPFNLGMDFLSEDKGYEHVQLKNSSTLLSYPTSFFKSGKNFEVYNVSEYDTNCYSNKCVFETNNTIQQKIRCVFADVKNNFINFITKIQWARYHSSEPKSLYGKRPIVTIHELMKISYKDEGRHISIEPMSNPDDTN